LKLWMNILGRGGTTLIAISIALLLVSLLPLARIGGISNGVRLTPDTFSPLRTLPPPFISFYDTQLTPQRELEMKFSATSSAKVYLLTTEALTVMDWISEQKQIDGMDYNLTSLNEFLETHPDLIGWQSELDREEIQHTYSVEKITNATIMLANPTSENVSVTCELRLMNSLAPSEKVRTISYFAAPIGIVMAIPWLLDVWKQRKKK
jgi:hypothetical protein